MNGKTTQQKSTLKNIFVGIVLSVALCQIWKYPIDSSLWGGVKVTHGSSEFLNRN